MFCRSKRLSPVTVRWYRSILDHFVQVSTDLSFDSVIAYLEHIRPNDPCESRIAPHKYSATTLSMHHRALKVFFNYLVDHGVIDRNPMKKIKLKPVPAEFTLPSVEEVKRLDMASPHLGRTFGTKPYLPPLLLDGGLPPGELLSLQGKDVDFDRNRAKVKGKTGPRMIYYSDSTRRAMLAYLRTRPDRGVIEFFLSERGGPLNRDSLRNILQRARKRAGIKGRVYTYQLRHLCATCRLREGMKEEELRELLGHRPGSKMLSVYVNMTDDDLEVSQRTSSASERTGKTVVKYQQRRK